MDDETTMTVISCFSSILINEFPAAYHSKKLLRQRVMGQEVELCGVLGECWVGGRWIVEPGAQRQVFSEQLHVILYPL